MSLKKGTAYLRENTRELLAGPLGEARRKAIKTIAKKDGISFEEARRKQAQKILKTFL